MNPRRFYRITEVAKMLGVEPHTLRYWQTRFPGKVLPSRGRGKQRVYSSRDVAVLAVIRDLTRVEGYTLRGVARLLRRQSPSESVAAE